MATKVEEVDKIAKQQENLGKEINRYVSNMKKDTASRKNDNYFQERLTAINKLWQEIRENHKEIEKIGCKEHNYYEQKYIETLHNVYEEAIKSVHDNCNKFQIQQTIQRLDLSLNRMEDLFSEIKIEILRDPTKERKQQLKEKITTKWQPIEDMYQRLEDDDQHKTSNLKFKNLEKTYEEIQLILQRDHDATTSKSCNIELPKIKLPLFEGRYDAWNTFRDIFTKVVHDNTTLTNIEKMQYLKTHVRGEASRLIQHLQIADANYQASWKILEKRYTNDRLLANKLMDKILDIPNIHQKSAVKLKQLHDTVQECLEALNNLKIDTSSWGPMVSRIICRKWDAETNRLYEQSLDEPHQLQPIEKLMAFILRRFNSLETSDAEKNKKVQTSSNPIVCPYCKDYQHRLYACPKFQSITSSGRLKFVNERKICANCLNHDSYTRCFSENRCHTCRKFHHTLLHVEKHNQEQNHSRRNDHAQQPVRTNNFRRSYSTANTRSQQHPQNTANHSLQKDEMVILATARVRVPDAHGNDQHLRILVDTGSQCTFITEEVATLLALPRQKIQADITGVGAGNPQNAKWKIEALVKPRFTSNFALQVPCIILPKLTHSLPTRPLTVGTDEWKNEMLADPTFSRPGPIDMILGAREYGEIILEGIKKSEDGILGQNTELGWILSGAICTAKRNKLEVHGLTSLIEEDEQLMKFWELEEVSEPRQLTEAERFCEEHYNVNTIRNPDGTYTVRIPFNELEGKLGVSKNRAAARLAQLEKRFVREESLRQDYKRFMFEYQALGHMEKVRQSDKIAKYYIPHQPVLKDSNSTTKLRVVFDASSKTSNGRSLNETMYTGPRLQPELPDILLRWRFHKVVITADIEKMYRQIHIHPEDQQYQRILWRSDPARPMEEYSLTTVTYGTTAAPYLAIKTIQRLAEDEKTRYPKAALATKLDFYVDDLLSGADTIEEAIQLKTEMIGMFKSGGFSLRKWSSNSREVMQSIESSLKDQTELEITQDHIRKSLGIHWAPHDDTFRFKASISASTKVTKRNILSEVAKLFDPLGWLAPVVIKAKLLIQELWLQNLRWDDEVPQNIQSKWKEFQGDLKNVEKIILPRWTKQTLQSHIELHGFCDASEKAYGAVVYIKVPIKSTQNFNITLLTAKSKVAPVRMKATLPRLELCAALLLAKILRRTVADLPGNMMSVHAWTDSMIALSWIQGDPTRWKTFVANRVTQINGLIPKEHWNHVKTEDNPADAISRGLEPSKLIKHKIWWQGPEWLKLSTDKNLTAKDMPATPPEEVRVCHTAVVRPKENEILTKFSTLNRLVRTTSLCRRFISNCRNNHKATNSLSLQELQDTLEQMVRNEQQMHFPEEIKSLRKQAAVQKTSRLLSLNPFLDNKGTLRVGGRLEKSQLSYERKHPMILPYNCHLTNLVIMDAHHRTLHGGNQMTLAQTRKQFWIINAKRTIKSLIGKCVKCIRFKAETAEQLMGNLPTARITPAHPFLHSGVDYAGPVQIKTTKGRGYKAYKGYIAIFVCLATKAIHIEVVSDMSADTFLAAFRRFVARRGQCAHIYSDNGTNFVGASKVLNKEIQNIIEKSNIEDKLVNIGTQWHFIPPASPHFGGLWEAGVKSMKYHMKRVIGETCLTYEEMTTLMHQIEACLNSRPLCAVNDDPSDPTILTPGHFLIGRPMVEVPDPISTNINSNLNERWKLIQKIKVDLWKRWSSDYLNQLQQRYKWKTLHKTPGVGEVVLVKEDDVNPSKWPLAKIIEVHPSEDQVVRVVSIKKAGGNVVKRPIHKLIHIPTHPDRTKSETRKKGVKLWRVITLAIMFIITLQSSTAQKYTVHYPPPGLYIERIGHAKIDRGIFRLELRFDKYKLSNDTKNIGHSISQLASLCDSAKELAANMQCYSLINHLREKQGRIEWMDEGMREIVSKRPKRGLVGKLLTSVFGVNDEVYMDIDKLEQNQKELIKASSHQTKFMLHALTEFNKTEIRINSQLRLVQERVNETIKAIKEMSHWYKRVDENLLNIHFLSSYEMVSNYIDNIMDYHQRLLDVHYHRSHLFELTSPIEIEQAIANISAKLPSNLQIVTFPLIRTGIHHTEKCIHVFGYFLITEVDDFVITKATPIPLKITPKAYWILDVPNGNIAVNYNRQLYFEISEEEFHDCIIIHHDVYVCSPATTRNIEFSPHCVIDEIYQRTENTTCSTQENRLQSMIWKQLVLPNAWLFISPSKMKVAVICDGIRDEVTLNYTGIIEISQNCFIKTNKNILTPKRTETTSVQDTMFQPARLNIDSLQPSTKAHFSTDEEPVITASENLGTLMEEELEISNQLKETRWVSLSHHVIITSTTTSAVALAAIIIGGLWYLRRRHKQHKSPGQHDSADDRGIELDTFQTYSKPTPQLEADQSQ